jgi:uncharacterized membrane protein YeaQ/YmgE (transglycosylase-associated protein family)
MSISFEFRVRGSSTYWNSLPVPATIRRVPHRFRTLPHSISDFPNCTPSRRAPYVAAPTTRSGGPYSFCMARRCDGLGYVFQTIGGINMLFIIWIVVGGILGWLASLVMKTDAEQGMILNVVVGIIGAFLGGWLLSPLFGTGTINSDDFSITSLLVSFLGAVILLAIVNLLRRGKTR